eukprot:COSAG02_NODE_2705_length_8192_cov_49.489806_5_plen_172_part_00
MAWTSAPGALRCGEISNAILCVATRRPTSDNLMEPGLRMPPAQGLKSGLSMRMGGLVSIRPLAFCLATLTSTAAIFADPRYRVRYYRGAFDPNRGGIKRFRNRQQAGILPGSSSTPSRQHTSGEPQRRPTVAIGRQPPPLFGFCHVGPDGQRHPYSANDNRLIFDARNRSD